MSNYAKVRKELAEQRSDDKPKCRRCKGDAPWQTLSDHGGMCFPCYAAYCREPQKWPDIGDKRNGPRDWAHALKRRHESGERLTPAQITAYTAALRQHLEPTP